MVNNKKNEIVEKLWNEKQSKLSTAIVTTDFEQQAEDKKHVTELENKCQCEVEQLWRALSGKEEHLQETLQHMQTMAAPKKEVEDELEETRLAFKQFIFQFPKFRTISGRLCYHQRRQAN